MSAPIRVVIADDEPLARRGIEQLLARHHDCVIVASCRNGREALRALREARPDVAFLDIQMPGLGGFDVLREARGGSVPSIVFVTAHDEFAVRAFEERALDYLLKPVAQSRFDEAIARVRERRRSDAAAHPSAAPLVVPHADGELVLRPEEIDWIEAVDYCAAIHAGGRRYVVRESLASLEARLGPAGFIRVHRSAIVRVDRIRELRTGDAGPAALVLRDGTRIPVSRRRRERVAVAMRGG